jgi:RNA polymerase primary sigma factor
LKRSSAVLDTEDASAAAEHEPISLDEATEAIAARGRERGFVTSEELLEGLPADRSPEQTEDYLTYVEDYLRQEGLEIMEVPGKGDGGEATGGSRLMGSGELLKTPTYDPVRMYLKDIGKVPLLTAAQEVDLGMRMEGGAIAAELLGSIDQTTGIDKGRFRRMVDLVVRIREQQLDPDKKLRREGIGREKVTRSYRPKSRAEATGFLRRVERDARIAKDRLIEANLRLVVSIAKRYARPGMPFLDGAQEGNVGLIRATEKYDHTMGYKFSTYATWWIRQAITRAIADRSRVIRVPVHISEYLDKLRRAQRDLLQELRREPLPDEIGRRIGIPAGKVQQILEMSREPISLETPTGEDEDSHLGDLIEDPEAVVPVEAASFMMLQEHIGSELHSLSAREKKVIQLRFGLPDGHPRTLEEVGREFGLTRERIRQIEAKALSKLRHPSRSRGLRDYLE